MKGKIEVGEGKIINVGLRTEYYFGNLVKGMVPDDAKKKTIGRCLHALRGKTVENVFPVKENALSSIFRKKKQNANANVERRLIPVDLTFAIFRFDLGGRNRS